MTSATWKAEVPLAWLRVGRRDDAGSLHVAASEVLSRGLQALR